MMAISADISAAYSTRQQVFTRSFFHGACIHERRNVELSSTTDKSVFVMTATRSISSHIAVHRVLAVIVGTTGCRHGHRVEGGLYSDTTVIILCIFFWNVSMTESNC